MDTSIAIDGIVIVLLAATIVSAFRLERKLDSLRNAQASFAEVTGELNAAAARAEASIRGLKATADSSGRALDEQMKQARGVGDELAVLLQAGQRAAQRAESARPAAPRVPWPKPTGVGDATRILGGMR